MTLRIFKTLLYACRFAIGSTLFSIFYFFLTGEGECKIPSGSPSLAYAGFTIITTVLFLELGYAIIRTRSYPTKGRESRVIARAGFFLFDSTYLLLGSITAFAALYLVCPVIQAECISGRDALYFSMVTFTTLGYGDLVPADPFKIVAAGQAILGYITLGLIVGYAGSLFNTGVESRGENS